MLEKPLAVSISGNSACVYQGRGELLFLQNTPFRWHVRISIAVSADTSIINSQESLNFQGMEVRQDELEITLFAFNLERNIFCFV